MCQTVFYLLSADEFVNLRIKNDGLSETLFAPPKIVYFSKSTYVHKRFGRVPADVTRSDVFGAVCGLIFGLLTGGAQVVVGEGINEIRYGQAGDRKKNEQKCEELHCFRSA